MTMSKWLSGAALAALGTVISAPAGFAAAGDECVKVLGYEWSGEKQSMDPADMHSGDDAYHTFAVYNRLVDIDDNFNVLPELATEWSVSPDGLTWTFKLRSGVKFHSGKDFSSADVVYSFKRLLDEKTGSGARAVLEFLDSNNIKAVDPTTVTFTTKKPVVELPVLITNKFTNIVPDGARQQDLRKKGDGTGPFMQEQFTPNAPVRILRKNPNYWNAGQPKADCIRITVAQEPVAAVAAIKAGRQDYVYLGNLDALRDWGYAPEYVEGMWRILQADEPDDYVLATGVGITVREFLQVAFGHVGLDWEKYVRFDERYLRPTEVDALIGDAAKARSRLGWVPTVHGRDLARLMVDADVTALEHAGRPWIDTVPLAGWKSPVSR